MGLDGWWLLQGADLWDRELLEHVISPSFMPGAGPAGTDPESIRDQVHALNESVQRQLEEADRRYMELYCATREMQQWRQ